MKAEEYTVRQLTLAGWPVRVTIYRLDSVWYAKADNVSPGARIAQARAATRAEAEDAILARARERLSATRRVS